MRNRDNGQPHLGWTSTEGCFYSSNQLAEIWYDFPMLTAIGMKKENHIVLLKPQRLTEVKDVSDFHV